MHYLLLYMYPSNDDLSLGKRVRPKRNGLEHLMVVCSKANIMRMTMSASGYFCIKERKVMDHSLKLTDRSKREKIRPGCNYCENLFFD